MNTCWRPLAAVGILAASSPCLLAASPVQEHAVVSEIAKRSGLPAETVEQLLGNCAANQQSIDFCAWRDQIEAEQALSDVALKAKTLSPRCDGLVSAQLSAWEKKRDMRCAAEVLHGSAPDDGSLGSLTPAGPGQSLGLALLSGDNLGVS